MLFTLVNSFRQFIEDNNDEIEAINILYSRHYGAGLRYRQIKDLARHLSIKPFHVDEPRPQTLLKLWQAFGKQRKPRFANASKSLKWQKEDFGLTRRVVRFANDLSNDVFSFRSAF